VLDDWLGAQIAAGGATGLVLGYRRQSETLMNPLLDIDGLARILKRGASTIHRDIRRNPDAVPPRLTLPGTRLLRWREADVASWLDAHAPKCIPREGGNS